MADLESIIEFSVEFYKFHNVDLFQRGYVVFYFIFYYLMLDVKTRERRKIYKSKSSVWRNNLTDLLLLLLLSMYCVLLEAIMLLSNTKKHKSL